MSTEWDLQCVDCNTKHGFEYQTEYLMAALVRHAAEIARFHAVITAPGLAGDVRLVTDVRVSYPFTIDTEFFVTHAGHHLVPIDEHGNLTTDCTDTVQCGECGGWHRCKLPRGHVEPHDPKLPGRAP